MVSFNDRRQPPARLYHYSPGEGERVESIKKHGLLPRDPTTGHSLAEASHDTPAVYMFRDRDQAQMLDDGDVWEVNAKGLNLEPDPAHADWPGGAWRSKEPIPPERVRHLGPSGNRHD